MPYTFNPFSGNLDYYQAAAVATTVYDYQEKEVGGTYIYWGFDSTGTGYRIVRQTIIGGAWAESIGTYPTPYANYAAAWAARAALSYT